MKKIYFVPETDVVALSGQSIMLNTSEPNVGLNSGGSVDAASVDTREHRGFGNGMWEDMK